MQEPNRRTKLKNVSSLLSLDDEVAPNREVAIAKIDLSPHQPRNYFDPEKMQELVASIKLHGVLEPILLRPQGKDRYQLVAGERRFRACQEIGHSTIPAIIKQLSDEEASLISLVENLQRENLNPVEETEAILQILALKLKISQEQVAAALYRMRHELRGEVEKTASSSLDHEIIKSTFDAFGLVKWETFISHRLPLLNLPEQILEALRKGQIEYTKATAIATVKDGEKQQLLLAAAINKNLSLAEIKEQIKDIRSVQSSNQNLSKATTLKGRFSESYLKLKKSSVWEDKKKQRQIEKLLLQIESLIEEK
jgi:ParB family transcriptional regulator, chromosome partitioning protein